MQQVDALVHQQLPPPLERLPLLGAQTRILQRSSDLPHPALQQHPAFLIFPDHLFHVCPPVLL